MKKSKLNLRFSGGFWQAALIGASAVAGVLCTTGTESAIANGDTRTLHLVNAHTHEAIDATYMVNGHYDSAVLAKLNWFLRDWRRKKEIQMDPHLFDIVWDAYRLSGSHEPIVVLCGYRSAQTNAMLRRRSKLVAKFSQHILGKAMDQHYVDVPMSKIREIGMKMQMGGVGYYPHSGTPFVHLDAGSVRYWPRMSRTQLVRMFPNGKTVDIPADGVPLKGYEEARAEIAARGWNNAPVTAIGKPKGFFARLFGGDSGDDGETGQSRQVASASQSGDDLRFFPPQFNGTKPQAEPTPQPPRAVAARPAIAARPQPGRALPAEVELASLGKPRDIVPSTPVAVPLPPQRPSGLSASLQLATVPLPPQRPVELASLDKNYMQTQVAIVDHGKPTVLPEIITRGTQNASAPAGGSALAYADMASPFDGLMVGQPLVARKGPRGLPSALRVPHAKTVVAKTIVASAGAALLAWRGQGTSLRGHAFRSQSVSGMIAPPLRASQSGLSGLLFDPPAVAPASTFELAQASLPSDHFSHLR